MKNNNDHGKGVVEASQRRASYSINRAFNEFLQIADGDKALLARYHTILERDAQRFAAVFYEYLFAFPATAEVLKRFQANGGEIETLVQKQTGHLFNLLTGDTGEEAAAHLRHIGFVHFQHKIEPAWIMGAYLLYLDHLNLIVSTSSDIPAGDRVLLEDAVTKLLFRDMGLMLEGYWDASMQALQSEKSKVTDLQDQITSLLANIPYVLWSVDVEQNRPIYVSPATRKICDMDVQMPIPCLNWTVPEDREIVKLAWRQALLGERVEVESRVQEPGHEARWFRRVFYPFKDAHGKVVRIDGLMDDTTDSKKTMERLHFLANTDSLTGLPNRSLLYDRLGQAIAAAQRDARQVVFLLMDLDRFKDINDTLGHPAGDEILRQVSRRLQSVLRESDTLARLGGDEFAILLPDAAESSGAARRVARNVLDCFIDPYWYGDHELYLGAAIGISIFPDHGDDADTLMSRADVAMYGAKHKDMGFLFYDSQSDPNTQQRLQLASELRHAIERNELVLYYQPKIDIASRSVNGVEALIRWRHPQQGLVMPDHFIPFAERSGLINPLTDWVIKAAAEQCRVWRESGITLRIAINVSSRFFQDPKLTEKVRTALDGNDTAFECLEIEITENMLIGDIEHCSRGMRQLNDLGLTIAIDDFGTGYSSLSYLKKLPIHSIKVDKSFVLNMGSDDNDAVIVRSTIDLAHNLGYKVTAEGVENQESLNLLEILGCDNAQGYFMCHPLPPEQLAEWLKMSHWNMHSC